MVGEKGEKKKESGHVKDESPRLTQEQARSKDEKELSDPPPQSDLCSSACYENRSTPFALQLLSAVYLQAPSGAESRDLLVTKPCWTSG